MDKELFRKRGKNIQGTLKATEKVLADIPLKIVNMRNIEGQHECLVKWQKRKGGKRPFRTWVEKDELKQRHPLTLAAFYLERLGIELELDERKKKLI